MFYRLIKGVILAFADVRNTKFALNLRRINVAISRAIQYVELIVHENILNRDNLEQELREYDRQEEEDERMSGRPRSYCVESLNFLKFFVQVAKKKEEEENLKNTNNEFENVVSYL